MSIIGSNILAGASGSGVSAYEIEQSLRFDGSSYLTHTHGSTPTGDNGTLSVWVKRRGTNYDYDTIIEGLGSGNRRAHYLRGASNGTDGRIDMHQWFPDAGGIDGGQVPDAQLRDPSAWYHLLWQHQNSSTRSVSDRLWVNGVEQTDITTPGNHNAQPWEVTRNSATATIGRYGGGYGYLQGYIAEMHCIDGSLVDADEFGEYDDNGVWRPIEYDGTYGNNGFYLKFDPSATNGIGHDHSGNSNNFTANNFTTSGTGTDVMSDTPTTNWCTFNPLNSNGSTLSNGNLDASGTSNLFQSTIMVNSGKYYFEFTKNANGDNQFGIAYGGSVASTDAFRRAWRDNNGSPQWLTDAAIAGSGTPESCAVNDVVGVALDMDNNAVYFSKNGTYMNSGDPTSGSSKTGAIWTDLAGQSWGPMVSANANGLNCTLNCGQRDFAYTPPTGFKALNTSNLPEPDIADGSEYFNTVLYTGVGTGSSQSVTGVGFQPDWLWLKGRDFTSAHKLIDSVRGVSKVLESNSTGAEGTSAISSFDSDGFTISGGSGYNNANPFVAWNWKAGGSTSSNTDGGITSTVSANPSAGFSIVSWAGSGNTTDSVGHGLGVTPKLNIIKSRDSSSLNWYIYTTVIDGSHDYLYFDTGAKKNSGIAAPTSTVINLNADIQPSGQDMIAYCFAEVESYSRIGSYVGNGSSDGPFVYCGFRPAWVMIKATAGSGNSWYISDNKRNTYNVVDGRLLANSTNGESTSVDICDFTANGFKIRTDDSGWNTSGTTYIFASFSENPFGGSGVSPATAR